MRDYLAHHEWAQIAIVILGMTVVFIVCAFFIRWAHKSEEARKAWLKYWFGKGYVLKVDRDERVGGSSFSRCEGCNFMGESEAAALAREITAHGTKEDHYRFKQWEGGTEDGNNS